MHAEVVSRALRVKAFSTLGLLCYTRKKLNMMVLACIELEEIIYIYKGIHV